MRADARTVWLFDLDNTLHDAGRWVFGELREAMGDYVAEALQIGPAEARQLNLHYWHRHGATLLGLMRHHGVKPAHFLHATHRLPGLERQLSGHRHDFAALSRLPGRKFILTNAPRRYALRVLDALRIGHLFDGVIAIDDMFMFGHLRPKPDARMLRRMAARLRVAPSDCVLVEDTLEHQKAARRVGMKTVWMQRWARAAGTGPAVPARLRRRPAYVDRRISTLRALHSGG